MKVDLLLVQASKRLCTDGIGAFHEHHLRIEYSLPGPNFIVTVSHDPGKDELVAQGTCAGTVWAAVQPHKVSGDLRKDGLKLLSVFGLTAMVDRLAVCSPHLPVWLASLCANRHGPRKQKGQTCLIDPLSVQCISWRGKCCNCHCTAYLLICVALKVQTIHVQ
jgi:hypothetical protein